MDAGFQGRGILRCPGSAVILPTDHLRRSVPISWGRSGFSPWSAGTAFSAWRIPSRAASLWTDICTASTVVWAIQKKTAEPLFRAPTCGCSATISQNHVLLWYPLPIFHFADVPSVDASAPSCTRAGSVAWQLTGALRFNHFLQNISVCLRAGFCWNWT